MKLHRNSLTFVKILDVTGKNKNKQKLTADLKEFVASKKILRADHHLCHAASVFYTRPKSIEDYLVITLDGQGDESSGKVFAVLGGELVEKVVMILDRYGLYLFLRKLLDMLQMQMKVN